MHEQAAFLVAEPSMQLHAEVHRRRGPRAMLFLIKHTSTVVGIIAQEGGSFKLPRAAMERYHPAVVS